MGYLREVTMERVWKPIKDYEGYYEVSSDGLVRSLERRVPYRIKGFTRRQLGRIMSPARDGYGYLFVVLHRNSVKKTKKVHQLVAETFIGEVDGKQVNHKDGDTNNNNVDNLEYVTPRENTWHAINVLGRRRDGEYHWHSKITNEDVVRMRELYKTGKYTQFDLSDIFGIHRGQISKILNHKSWGNIL
jgi:hypothetical protein